MSGSSHLDKWHIHQYISSIDELNHYFLDYLQYLELMVGTYE